MREGGGSAIFWFFLTRGDGGSANFWFFLTRGEGGLAVCWFFLTRGWVVSWFLILELFGDILGLFLAIFNHFWSAAKGVVSQFLIFFMTRGDGRSVNFWFWLTRVEGGVSQFLILAEKGGRGVWTPPFLAHRVDNILSTISKRYIFLIHFFTTSKNTGENPKWKDFCLRLSKMLLKIIQQMTEQLHVEVVVKYVTGRRGAAAG